VGEPGVSKLERRYRRLLRVLPEWYRRDREEEMVAIFLAGRTDEHGRPGWGETGAVLGLAVRTHLAAGAALTGVPGRVRWRGEVVRALGMLGLLLGIFYAGASIANVVVRSGSAVTWLRALDLAPVVAFLALCLGFHRDAPTPPMRRLLWWGGGALVLGVAGGVAAGGGLPAIVLVVVALRVVAYVRGDVVLTLPLVFGAVLPVRRAVRA
jgi:hypothetical protein